MNPIFELVDTIDIGESWKRLINPILYYRSAHLLLNSSDERVNSNKLQFHIARGFHSTLQSWSCKPQAQRWPKETLWYSFPVLVSWLQRPAHQFFQRSTCLQQLHYGFLKSFWAWLNSSSEKKRRDPEKADFVLLALRATIKTAPLPTPCGLLEIWLCGLHRSKKNCIQWTFEGSMDSPYRQWYLFPGRTIPNDGRWVDEVGKTVASPLS